ncbi:MAG: alpha/beta hydrolase [Tannerella sp.]|jgi:pimeloyl-ACP methyl ester carboxylesterase|nr:alpha/beta hydrolase [Tannerella sp.]
MNTSRLYKSREGRHILHNLYRANLLSIDVPVTERMVETRFGDTHVVLYGNPDGKPVLTFYGKNAINPLIVSPLIRGLDTTRLRLIVPDPPGCIGFSAERRAPLSDREYGEWAAQVMNGLKLSSVAVLGYSFGAMMALRLCTTSLLRAERLLLVTPSSVVRTSSSKIAKLMQPDCKNNERPLPEPAVRKMLAPVMPFHHDALTEMARTILLHAKIEKEGKKPVRKSKLKKFKAPVYIVAEESDYLFPGRKLIRRAKKIFPQLGGVRLLSTGSHWGLFREETTESLKECFDNMSNFLAK